MQTLNLISYLYFNIAEDNSSSRPWEIILAIIGGGIIVLLYQITQDYFTKKNNKSALICEIEMIVTFTDSFLSHGFDFQHNIQRIYMPIFNSNPTIITSFGKDKQKMILEFYNQIHWLNFRDIDNELLDNLLKGKNYTFTAYEHTRKDIATSKLETRKKLIEIGKLIIDNK